MVSGGVRDIEEIDYRVPSAAVLYYILYIFNGYFFQFLTYCTLYSRHRPIVFRCQMSNNESNGIRISVIVSKIQVQE